MGRRWLGVAWTEVDDNGGVEIVGVPDDLIRLFSKRRVQVETAAAGLIAEKQPRWAGPSPTTSGLPYSS
jgi:hypothetical protein